jgi:tetratricopeptide (TPR) repeat protein
MDWGLAKVLGGEPEPAPPTDDGRVTEVRTFRDPGSDTQAGSVLGTPAFMPPEQAGGEVAKVDERSDVFGLGAILCVILTGQPPYPGTDGEAVRLMAIRGRLADCLARLDACGADRELIDLCKRCLAPEQDDRPRDAGAVAVAVAEFRAAAEERARQAELDRATAEARATEGRKRRRVQRALAVAVVLLVLCGGGAAWWYDVRARVERERLARNEEVVEELLGECEENLRADDVPKAAIVLAAAGQWAAEGGADHLRDRLDRCRADLDMLRELDRIDDLWWATAEGLSQKDKAAEAWPAAFDRFGIAPGRTPPADVAARLRESVIRDRALAALDFWFLRDRSPDLLAVLREADPDPFRDAVRAAVHGRNDDQVLELAAGRGALGQPVRFALVLGRLGAIPADRRVEILKVALRSRPSSLGVLMELGGCFAGERPETAVERIRWYQVATSVRPTNAIAHFQLGVALHHKGDHDGALVAFGEAVLLDWKLAGPQVGIGAVRHALGDRDGALAAWQEAVRLDPGGAHAHSNIGGVLTEKGDADGAIAACREAIRLDPKLAGAHSNLANALLLKRDFDGAAAAAWAATRLDPKVAKAHVNLGLALLPRGMRNRAAVAFREAIQLEPGLAAAHAGLGDALRAGGDRDGAIAAYREAVRLEPGRIEVHRDLVVTLLDNGEPTAAVAAAREAVRVAPRDASTHAHLGRALESQGNPEAAIPVYEESLRLNANDGRVRLHLGMCLRETNKVDGAIPHLREAVRLTHGDAQAHTELGYALHLKEDWDGAIAAYREGVRLDPMAPNAHYNLGLVLQVRGDLAGAIESFKLAQRLDPTDPDKFDALRTAQLTRDGRIAPPPREVRR